jgi:hypothetical protein
MSSAKRRPIAGLFNDKRKQLNYGFLNVFASVLVVLIINTLYLYKFSKTAELCGGDGGADPAILSDYFNVMIIGSLAAVVLSGGICFVFAILLTHRFLGPMVPIFRHIEMMKQGQFADRIKLREKDEMHELGEKLNELTAELEKKYGKG